MQGVKVFTFLMFDISLHLLQCPHFYHIMVFLYSMNIFCYKWFIFSYVLSSMFVNVELCWNFNVLFFAAPFLNGICLKNFAFGSYKNHLNYTCNYLTQCNKFLKYVLKDIFIPKKITFISLMTYNITKDAQNII